MKYKWTIEIEVDEIWVADGFDPDSDWVQYMMEEMFPYATPDEVAGRVLKSPPPAKIKAAQGYPA